MKRIALILLITAISIISFAQEAPKREFRGAWIQCVNGQWQGIGRDKMQQTLTNQLDELQRCGINVIIFQVRAEGDALYASTLEPWSRYLTGVQGQAPNPYWDPLEWMVTECHKRGMELHAWINPYRARTKTTKTLSPLHQAIQHPERCFEYDGLTIFDPGVPENAEWTRKIAQDIVSRYDVDGLHIDDYFYPYPVTGVDIPDAATYQQYGNGMNIGDWRRDNVNRFIRQLNLAVKSVKPWCKFGVSPFGIYHNEGRIKGGVQNYDDLYADVLKWVDEGWVDYNVPQIYWEIGNKVADYDTLIRWWSMNAWKRPLVIGQDVERTVKFPDLNNPNQNQMVEKYRLQRMLPGIQGSCQWYAKAVCDNPGNYATMLKQVYHRYPALQPSMPWIDKKAPKKPVKARIIATTTGPALSWKAPKAKREMDKAQSYVIYRFDKGEKPNLKDATHIISITRETQYGLPSDALGHTYLVTAIDRLANESKAVKVKL